MIWLTVICSLIPLAIVVAILTALGKTELQHPRTPTALEMLERMHQPQKKGSHTPLSWRDDAREYATPINTVYTRNETAERERIIAAILAIDPATHIDAEARKRIFRLTPTAGLRGRLSIEIAGRTPQSERRTPR